MTDLKRWPEDNWVTQAELHRRGGPSQPIGDTREEFALLPHLAAKGNRDSLPRAMPVSSWTAAVGNIRGRTRGVPASGGKEQ